MGSRTCGRLCVCVLVLAVAAVLAVAGLLLGPGARDYAPHRLFSPEDEAITLCTPCVAAHVPALWDLAASINDQTRKPDRWVISLCGTADASDLQESLSDFCACPVEVRATRERLATGPNRNAAADGAHTRYLTFMDADDTCHPQRTEIVAGLLRTHRACALVHSFTTESDWELYPSAADLELVDRRVILEAADRDTVALFLPSPPCNGTAMGAHMGHISIPTATFREIRQENRPGEEDSVYVREIIRRLDTEQSPFLFVKACLSRYRPQLSAGL